MNLPPGCVESLTGPDPRHVYGPEREDMEEPCIYCDCLPWDSAADDPCPKRPTSLSNAAEQAAKSLADEVREKIVAIPTTDTEQIAIQIRVAELLGGPREAH